MASTAAASGGAGIIKTAGQGAVSLRWGKPVASAPVADIASQMAGSSSQGSAGEAKSTGDGGGGGDGAGASESKEN